MELIHYVYICFVILIFVALIFKQEIVIPCFVGIFTVGLIGSNSVIGGVSALYNALILAGNEFWPIILIISLVVSMSKIFSVIGADLVIAKPLKKLMVNKEITFLVIGFIMFVCSLIIWPSPAVALIGAAVLPFALKLGLNPVWIAVAMNICGHGMGLSADFFIQGAPTITAKSAELQVIDVINASIPIWLVMSLVTLTVAFIMMKIDLKKDNSKAIKLVNYEIKEENETTIKSKVIAFVTILVFIIDLIILVNMKLTGSDATSLIGGSVIIILIICVFSQYKHKEALEKCVDYLKDGFSFGIKVFAPVIVIGGFFFLGNEDMAPKILGGLEVSILNDISFALSSKVGISKVSAVLTQSAVAVTAGLDGSGFSGLPIVGTLAYSFGNAIDVSVAKLAALGQIITIWVGGGTIIPWAVVPVAAICKVSPTELVRKNFIPVICGIVATVAYVIFTI